MRLFFVILFSWPCLQAQQTADLLKMVRDAYGGAKAFHIVAERTDSVSSPGRPANEARGEYELAEAPGGKYFAHVKLGNEDSLAVSDGSATWKALPKQKRWMKVEAAELSDDENDVESQVSSREGAYDLRGNAENVLIRRYLAILELGQGVESGKAENVKVGGVKHRCRVIRREAGSALQELWIDEQRGFVLQARQTSVDGDVQMQFTMKLKELELNDSVDARLFSFRPEPSWTEAEMLVLPGEERAIRTGQRAADFALKSLDGETVMLSSLHGKVVVLDFWATWCGPCRRELPAVDKLRAEFGDSVQFFGINDEENGTVRGFLKKTGYGLTTLMDSKRAVHRTYGVHAIPTIFVIDRDGIIRKHFIGGRDAPELRQAIAAVLGVATEPAEARP